MRSRFLGCNRLLSVASCGLSLDFCSLPTAEERFAAALKGNGPHAQHHVSLQPLFCANANSAHDNPFTSEGLQPRGKRAHLHNGCLSCNRPHSPTSTSQTTPATTSTTPTRQPAGAADAQTARPATSSTAPAHQQRGSANTATPPAGAPAASADRTQRPDADVSVVLQAVHVGSVRSGGFGHHAALFLSPISSHFLSQKGGFWGGWGHAGRALAVMPIPVTACPHRDRAQGTARRCDPTCLRPQKGPTCAPPHAHGHDGVPRPPTLQRGPWGRSTSASRPDPPAVQRGAVRADAVFFGLGFL